MRRVLIGLVVIIAVAVGVAFALLVIFSDNDDNGDSVSSPTPTPTDPIVSPGQLTPNANACTTDIMEGDLISVEGAAGHAILTLEATNTDVACTLDGPPELRWYTEAGVGAGIPFIPAADCDSDETDFSACIFTEVVELPPADASPPAGMNYKVRAIVSVASIGAIVPCASEAPAPVEAAVVGLQFPGVPLDVQIDLDDPIQLQACVAQVELLGYGPVKTDDD